MKSFHFLSLISFLFFLQLLSLSESNSNTQSEDINLLASSTSVDLYVEDSGCISFPSTYRTQYQISAKADSTFSVSGGTVTCSATGLVQTKCSQTTYTDHVIKSCSLGKSTVTVKENKVAVATYTFNVISYSQIAADKVIDNFISKNITSKMSNLDKLKKITEFPAYFSYSTYWRDWDKMINCGGGSCTGSSRIIVRICEKIGLKCHIRYGVNDPGADSSHKNVAAEVSKNTIYVAEAGIVSTKTPRYSSVREENSGFYYKLDWTGDYTKINVLQYDGFDEDIVIPSKINNDLYTIVSLGKKAMFWGQDISSMKIKSIKLPNSLEIIDDECFSGIKLVKEIYLPLNVSILGQKVFTNMQNLTEINVDSENLNFTSHKGVLYNSTKDQILFYPTAKEGEEYILPEDLKKIGNYAFSFTKNLKKIYINPEVETIGEGAFSDSNIKEIYFAGNPPNFGKDCFSKLNFTGFYPKGNSKWSNIKNSGKYGAVAINWTEWKVDVDFDNYLDSGHGGLIAFIIILLILIAAGAGTYFYFKKYRKAELDGLLEKFNLK